MSSELQALMANTACSASPKPSAEKTGGQDLGSWRAAAHDVEPISKVMELPGSPKRACQGGTPAQRHRTDRSVTASGTRRKLKSRCTNGTIARSIERSMQREWVRASRRTTMA
eukprot:CAMPEP_0174711216 /NCGR_PEP_ID=MMETSP1094-20130205/12610_1 /TAXON_ID=156173 /ORGANISM="Chrysochromulina brevifilum, Strain UTEX LB 985" /LENGTH=112 /DNA_ID=CAMNT_0015910117 /DNA_START=32 /DNA_END=370 /DNA_ORIENTATION=-